LLGGAQVSDIDHAFLGFAAVAWGLQSASLPLGGIGMPGCTLLTNGDQSLVSFCASTSATTAEHTLGIPLAPILLGVHLHLQAWTLAPGVTPLGIVVSNGLELVIGDV
jgi:hypothetical protein